MKLITDNAFSKAWEVKCPTCNKENQNSILWFRKQCNDCAEKDNADKKYTEEDIRHIIYKGFLLGVDRGFYSKELEDELINSLNKQD